MPLAFISTVMIGFGLSIICVLATSPYKVKEERQLKKSRFSTLDNLQSPKQVLLWHAVTFTFICLALISSGFIYYQITTPAWFTKITFSTLFTLAMLSFAVFNTFCLCRRGDVFTCLKSNVPLENHVESPENEELVTDNFVELCARPLPPPATSSTIRGIDPTHLHPKTSSPVHSHVPIVQDITVSPLTMANVTNEVAYR